MYEVHWLKAEAVFEKKRFEKLEEALRDACQLSSFLEQRFGVTHVEVWDAGGSMLLQMPAAPRIASQAFDGGVTLDP